MLKKMILAGILTGIYLQSFSQAKTMIKYRDIIFITVVTKKNLRYYTSTDESVKKKGPSF